MSCLKIQKLFLTVCFLTIFSLAKAQTQKAFPFLPKYQTEAEKKLARLNPRTDRPMIEQGVGNIPEGFVIPGEYEESQAVIISWPFDEASGRIDVSTTSPFAQLYGKLSDAIQKEALLYIRVNTAADTTPVINFMNRRKTPLINYRFHISEGDAFWLRDFGPIGFYYTEQDSIGFLDLNYYDGRPLDDDYAPAFGKLIGYPTYSTKVNTEGGNFMTDGFRNAFYSSRVAEDNTYPNGIRNQWTKLALTDTLMHIYGLDVNELQSLECDGGTGHIDMYVKLIDEETIIATEYPKAVTSQDKKIVASNIDYLKSIEGPYGRPYKIHYIPFATDDFGTYALKCEEQFEDARGFINGLMINKTFIFPAYSGADGGNEELDLQVKSLYEKLLPGYKIIPIDARMLTPGGGAIHCITMQIPAENPIRFWHPSIRELQNTKDKNFPVMARITNRSGIKTATCYWRKKGETAYQSFVLKDTLIDDIKHYAGAIPNAGFTDKDTIQYYLHAEANNGKKQTKPITAPEGYIEFAFEKQVSVSEALAKKSGIKTYPNPANEVLYISVDKKTAANTAVDMSYRIINVLGGVVQNGKYDWNGIDSINAIQVDQLNNGIYVIEIYSNNTIFSKSKFTVLHQ